MFWYLSLFSFIPGLWRGFLYMYEGRNMLHHLLLPRNKHIFHSQKNIMGFILGYLSSANRFRWSSVISLTSVITDIIYHCYLKYIKEAKNESINKLHIKQLFIFTITNSFDRHFSLIKILSDITHNFKYFMHKYFEKQNS